MNKTTFEEEIERTGKLVYKNVGNSMMPLIKQGRDLLIIEKTDGRLKKYDIPLYKRDNGQYVLHRILKVRENDYVICGDNRYNKEYGITDKNIIGVLTGMVRNGREISFASYKYRLYVHLWCDFFVIRAGILFARDFPGRVKRRIRRKRKH